MFWCISGFIISYMYLDNIRFKDSKKFFVNRFTRLYPLHFITLIIVAVLQFFSFKSLNQFMIFDYNDIYHFFLNIFFLSSWGFEKGMSFNQPIWSVSYEIIVYILFFICAINFKKLNLKSLSILYLLTLTLNKYGANLFEPNKFLYYSDHHNDIISCIQLFISGMIIYKLFMLNKKLLLLILSIIFLLISFTGNFKVFIFCPAVIMFAIGAENYLVIKSNFIRKIFSTMGKLTYSCYLIHFPVSLSLILFFNQNTTIFLNHYFFLSYLTFIISISVFIYFLIEKKIQDYFRTKLLK